MLGGSVSQVLNGMWEAGRCREAANTMLQALEAGVYSLSETAKVHREFSEGGRRVGSLRLDLHAHSVGAAQVRAAMWLLELKQMMQTGEGKAQRTIGFIPGQGHFKRQQQTGDDLQPRSVINEALQVRVVEQLGQVAHSARCRENKPQMCRSQRRRKMGALDVVADDALATCCAVTALFGTLVRDWEKDSKHYSCGDWSAAGLLQTTTKASYAQRISCGRPARADWSAAQLTIGYSPCPLKRKHPS